MGRSSERLRNPANRGPEWVLPILEAWGSNAAERVPTTIPVDNDVTGYVEPIVIQPLCLTCHGSDLASDVAARISELYPADRALGYEVGDLRGVFWVEIPHAD
jgi:hypothetical protein